MGVRDVGYRATHHKYNTDLVRLAEYARCGVRSVSLPAKAVNCIYNYVTDNLCVQVRLTTNHTLSRWSRRLWTD